MSRRFDPNALVQLPKLTAAGAVALGKELITAAANQGTLAPPIKKALTAMEKKHGVLRKSLPARLPQAGEGSPDIAAADRDIDAAWSAAYDWTTGWSKLPGKAYAPKAAIARNLLAVLFADGIRFTQLKYKLEWVESQARLDSVEERGLDEAFEELGGADVLKAIKVSHKRYGDLLGLSKAKPAEPELVALRGPLDDFTAALRTYVVRVSAHVDDGDPATADLAAALLAPLAAWESEGREKGGAAAPPAEPTAPAVGATP